MVSESEAPTVVLESKDNDVVLERVGTSPILDKLDMAFRRDSSPQGFDVPRLEVKEERSVRVDPSIRGVIRGSSLCPPTASPLMPAFAVPEGDTDELRDESNGRDESVEEPLDVLSGFGGDGSTGLSKYFLEAFPSPCKAVLKALRDAKEDPVPSDDVVGGSPSEDFLTENASESPLPEVLRIAVFLDEVLQRSSLRELGLDPVLKRSVLEDPELMLLNLPSRLREPELYRSSLSEPLPPDDRLNRSSLWGLVEGDSPRSSLLLALPDDALYRPPSLEPPEREVMLRRSSLPGLLLVGDQA